MIEDELYDSGLRLRREMFGSAGAEDQVENTTELDDKLQEIVTRNCFGDIWQRAGLERHTRSLITIGMLLALGRSHELRIHINGALANGVDVLELREVMLHSYLYCGIPAAVDGIRTLDSVLAAREAGESFPS
ncbi:carboxymuconolactone decarboxylase family protein [Halostreptopolyspora alba]|uniref:4-carboxymuconolactone decarboxylase n=1 Tax=Halostreptopolyspora alba TaxID=2487137 RepID=A0A3N0EBX4_9ACTN|nr:4-carboxymuconolactone decarboxylase [Nocardiopsaceae bacterium YIM 96095]